MLKILLNTGSNKNYIKPELVENPIGNQGDFTANSVSENTYFVKYFLAKYRALLPGLKTFHAILAGDSMRVLSAVIYTSENYFLLKHIGIIATSQNFFQDVNNIELRTGHPTKGQSTNLGKIIKNILTYLQILMKN